MDRLQAMHLFVRVAELNSFSAVAQQLGAARSVVTRAVRNAKRSLLIAEKRNKKIHQWSARGR